MALAGEGYQLGPDAPLAQGTRHGLGLPRRNDPVLEPLEEDHRPAEALRRVERRAIYVELTAFRIGPDQTLVVVGLELVRLPAERFEVTDPVVARAGGEDVVESERA